MSSGLIFDDDDNDVTMDVLDAALVEIGDDVYSPEEVADALRSMGYTVEPP